MFSSWASTVRGRFRSLASLRRHAPIAATCARASSSERNMGVSFRARVRSWGVLTSCQPPKIMTVAMPAPSSASSCRRSHRLACSMGSSHHGRPCAASSPVQEPFSCRIRPRASPARAHPAEENFTSPANSPAISCSLAHLPLPMRRTARVGPWPTVVTTSTSVRPLLSMPGAEASTATHMLPRASRSCRATLGRKMMSP
mmetsp:Transcript_23304/g.66275  ORF Transcript_23304/g.66275 Transcript_23304/m.66275 type:complete len:200 (-) Transcript_23304:457-1056(-)